MRRAAWALLIGVVAMAASSAGVALIVRPIHVLTAFGLRCGPLVHFEVGYESVPAAKRRWWARYENTWAGEATIAYGWPLPALRCFAHMGSGELVVGWDRVVTQRSGWPRDDDPYPAEIVWPGVIVDSLVFGTMVYACLALWGAARRIRRRRRGMCVGCGYNLAGLDRATCPECGRVSPVASAPASKKEIRARLRPVLAAIPPDRLRAESTAACGQLLDSGVIPNGATVLLYAPLHELGEVDLTALVDGLALRSSCLCVPRVDWNARTMVPVRVGNLTDDLIEDPTGGRRGLRVPRPDAPEMPLDKLDVVVVPGLAFDQRGDRLGRGAGFYDRFLASLPAQTLRVSVALEEQIVELVPTEKHDQTVDLIATPTRLIRAPRPV